MSDVQSVSPEAAERGALYDRSAAARAKMADAKTYQEFADAAVENLGITGLAELSYRRSGFLLASLPVPLYL